MKQLCIFMLLSVLVVSWFLNLGCVVILVVVFSILFVLFMVVMIGLCWVMSMLFLVIIRLGLIKLVFVLMVVWQDFSVCLGWVFELFWWLMMMGVCLCRVGKLGRLGVVMGVLSSCLFVEKCSKNGLNLLLIYRVLLGVNVKFFMLKLVLVSNCLLFVLFMICQGIFLLGLWSLIKLFILMLFVCVVGVLGVRFI